MGVKCPKCHSDNPDTSRFCGNCAAILSSEGPAQGSLSKTIETPLRPLEKGSVLAGKYRIIEEIGRGGMGVVYQAEDTGLGRQVAIKVLPDQFAKDPERLARFDREAKVLASMGHPNIAAIHGLDESDVKRFIVMEFVEGETLAERLSRGPLAFEETLEICRQVAEGLEGAHEKGIIHRDLKPANIKITPEGKVKILDFGLAKAFRDEPSAVDPSQSPTITDQMTRLGVIMGTAAYMSPEQAKGKQVDKRADIWAFGCILYECLTGKRAFGGETITETMASILKGEPDWADLPVSDPSHISVLLHRCLRKDPRERIRDIGDARIEIEEVLRSPAEPTKKNRRIGLLFAALALAFGAGAILVGAIARLWLAPPSPTPRVVRFTIQLPISRQLESISLSPDGRKLAYTGTEAGQSRIYVRSFDSGSDVPLTGTEGARAPFFSPEGNQVGFFVRNVVMKVPVAGGEPTTMWQLPEAQYATRSNTATWMDDGAILCSAGGAGIWRVPVSGERARLVAGVDPTRGECYFGRATLVAGGPNVLLSVKGGGTLDPTPLVLVSLDTGTRRPLVPDGDAPHYLATGHLVYWVRGRLVAAALNPARMKITGSTIPVVDAVGSSSQFSISMNGDLAYASAPAEGPSTLVRVDRKGSAVIVAELPAGNWGSISLSPDGRRIATAQTEADGTTSKLWTIDVDRGDLTLLGREGNPHAPVWSADGRSIVFSSHRGGTISNLFLQNADGTGEAKQLVQSRQHDDPGSWSRDGRWLAYAESSPETGHDLWTLDAQSQHAAVFRQTAADEDHPQISPDGAWLAYQSNETGRYEVYVEAFPAGGRRVKISLDGGTEPLWCEADRTLLYRSGSRLMSVRFGGQGELPTRDKPVLVLEGSFVHYSAFGTPAYAVSPDGRYFYFVRQVPAPPSAATIKVVLGWIEEFKRRLKGV
jgi:serine/threonine protein kinase